MNRPLVNIHTHRPADGETTLRTAGIHPWHAEECGIEDAAMLRKALGSAVDCAQAIGETGLDSACTAGREAQERLFRAHLQLAAELHLPVVIHCVRSFEAVMKILGEYGLPRVLFHGFIGSAEQARRAAERGYYLSFGLRSLRSPKTVAAMRTVPPESLFVETDDDDTPIDEVYRMAAAALGISAESLAQQTEKNYKTLTYNG